MNLLGNQYINGLVGNYRNITEQQKLERQKEEFIAIASHELKTPVTSIKGYTQIIKEHYLGATDTEVKGLIERLNVQVGRLSNLIENLLDVTKITGGQLELHLIDFDINELISELLEELNKTTKIEIIAELQPCEKIRADRARIAQVITNLVSNAIKYSSLGKRIIVRSSQVKGGDLRPAIEASPATVEFPFLGLKGDLYCRHGYKSLSGLHAVAVDCPPGAHPPRGPIPGGPTGNFCSRDHFGAPP
jgi:signal transduction histidine kinase